VTAIRPTGSADAEAIQRVGRAAWHVACDDVFGPGRVDRVMSQWWPVESLRGAAAADERLFLVAEDGDDRAVSVADAGPDTDERGTYRLRWLYVHPDHWGSGRGWWTNSASDSHRGPSGCA
jgi:GNAT superfamily N-acetyltransferase